jgi:hypothetical protein
MGAGGVKIEEASWGRQVRSGAAAGPAFLALNGADEARVPQSARRDSERWERRSGVAAAGVGEGDGGGGSAVEARVGRKMGETHAPAR